MTQRDFINSLIWVGIIFFCALLIPLLGLFFALFLPLPFLYNFLKLDLYQGILNASLIILIFGLMGFLIGAPQSVVMLFQFGGLAFILAFLYRNSSPISRIIFSGTVSLFVINLIVLYLWGAHKGMTPGEVVSSYIKGHFETIADIYKNKGVSQDNIINLKAYGQSISKIGAMIYPSVFFIGCGFTVWINMMVGDYLFKNRINFPRRYEEIYRWKSPEFLIWPFIASGFSLFIFSGSVKWIALNVFIVLCGIYAFQGFHILSFYLDRYRVHGGIKGIIYLMVFFQQIFWIVLFIAGIFDQWVNFRKLSDMGRA